MSGQGKAIGGITAVLGVLTAFILLMARWQDLRKSSAEADLAEQRRRAEFDAAPKKPPVEANPPPGGRADTLPQTGKPKSLEKAAEPVSRSISVERKLESPDPRVELTLVKIDRRTDRRIRWHFALWNQSGKATEWWVYPTNTYMTDEAGNRSDWVGSSMKDRFSLPDGVKLDFWVDFQEPLPGVRTLTAHSQPFGSHTFPNVTVGMPK